MSHVWCIDCRGNDHICGFGLAAGGFGAYTICECGKRGVIEAMKERPILFSGPMVRALLDGRKTQTRRGVKEWRPVPGHGPVPRDLVVTPSGFSYRSTCPYGQPGDRLWVRETWGISLCGNRVSLSPEAWPDGWPVDRLRYAADGYDFGSSTKRPSIHMPRWASRITLEVTDVRVQRLFEISEDDAKAEGADIEKWQVITHVGAFHLLWDSINAKRAPWASNPFVWVVSFKRINP